MTEQHKHVTRSPVNAPDLNSKASPHQPPIVPAASTASERPAKRKRCPECSADVPPTKTGVMRIFCAAECRSKYHARSKARGQALLPMLLAWRTGRGSTDIAKKAYAQVCAILDDFAAEDRAAGRPPAAEYAEKLLWMGTHRERRRIKKPASAN